jgi:hypothetical protein
MQNLTLACNWAQVRSLPLQPFPSSRSKANQRQTETGPKWAVSNGFYFSVANERQAKSLAWTQWGHKKATRHCPRCGSRTYGGFCYCPPSVAEGAVSNANRIQPLSITGRPGKLTEPRVNRGRGEIPVTGPSFSIPPAAGRMPAHLKEIYGHDKRDRLYLIVCSRCFVHPPKRMAGIYDPSGGIEFDRLHRLQAGSLTPRAPRSIVSPIDPAPGRRGVFDGALHYSTEHQLVHCLRTLVGVCILARGEGWEPRIPFGRPGELSATPHFEGRATRPGAGPPIQIMPGRSREAALGVKARSFFLGTGNPIRRPGSIPFLQETP